MSIFVTGDTHGPGKPGVISPDGFRSRFSPEAFPEQNALTKDDFVIICGDFGGVWAADKKFVKETDEEKGHLDWLENLPFTTLIIPGNHENYDRLTGIRDEKLLNCWLFAEMSAEEKQKFRQGYPRIPYKGGYARRIRPSVLMLEPGVFDIDDISIFAYGGAMSHDVRDGILDPSNFTNEASFVAAYKNKLEHFAQFRVKGLSWWEQEQPGEETETAALAALNERCNNVDFIITHCCATSDSVLLGYGKDIARIDDFLEHIKQTVTYKHWFFGHYHINYNLPGYKNHAIYETITRIH